jgi:hypothetical protein
MFLLRYALSMPSSSLSAAVTSLQLTLGDMLAERAGAYMHMAPGMPDDATERYMEDMADAFMLGAALFGDPPSEEEVDAWRHRRILAASRRL